MISALLRESRQSVQGPDESTLHGTGPVQDSVRTLFMFNLHSG
jgi:hypothetical protein